MQEAKIRTGMKDWTSRGRRPLNSNIAFERAVALQKQGSLHQAETIYREILKQNPSHFRTLYNLAEVLVRARRFEDAAAILRKALNQDANSARAHTLLAQALRNLERHEEALERARRAIALDPGYAEAHNALAQGLAELGRKDEALRALAQALERAPDQPSLYLSWGAITRWAAGDPRISTMEALAQKSGSLLREDQANLHFALAKAYADCGDIERSFRHQIEGGAVQRHFLKYDEAMCLRLLDELSRKIDAAWIARHQGVGDPSGLPVFILGMPRSGSTLIEQVLASHPKIRALGERTIFAEALAGVRGTSIIPPVLSRLATELSVSELRRLGTRYVEAARRGAPTGTARTTDKVPNNFQYVGVIHAALPNARIIHTCRNPIDTCLSIFSILFSGIQQPYSYDLGELGRYYRAYQKLMAHWHSILPPGVMLDVKYEELVDDFEAQARRIVAHCGLEWDDACLKFYETDRPVQTASHTQVRQPIYRSSAGRPRPPRELLLPLLEELGVDATC